ncbi:MAG: peptidoglycan-associated lipoprotein Pal [Alphaproteobacteria bacterium]|nr:peptidoglycan-associated lipoprotein Pal [Alphaproteobacteria bacterium]
MRMKVLTAFAALSLLAACSTPEQTTSNQAGSGAQRAQTLQEQLVAVGDRVFFDYDKSDLKPEARRQIERWAAFLRTNANATITIEGHCDERGTREYNLGLGERRANAAKNFLVSQGIEARRVATISYGKERPAVNGSNEAAWSQNRRGVAVVN